MKYLIPLFLVLAAGCENPVKRAVRNTTYSAYEMVGIQKRDILKTRIEDAKEQQKEAGEAFEDSLYKLRKMYGLEGGKLEKQYRGLKSSFETSKERVEEVQGSRAKMETVANDLFREWENEIDEIKTGDLKANSRAKLKATQSRFNELNRSLKASEGRMLPVLSRLNDHVLYLKHNLNAQSIASLKVEQGRIEGQIESVIKDMNQAIKQSDEFIKTIE